MSEEGTYVLPYTVDSACIDGALRLTLIGMVSRAQDLASFQFGDYGLSIPHLQKRDKTWVVSRQHFEVDEYPLWRDELVLTSWLEKPRGPFSYYDYEFFYAAPDGRKADLDRPMCRFPVEAEPGRCFLRANALWLVLSLPDLRPARAEGPGFDDIPTSARQVFPQRFSRLALPERFDVEQPFRPTRLDIDLNGHVNNISYVRYILQWVPQAVDRGMLVKALDTSYLSSAHFEDKLVCRSAVTQHEGDERTVIHSIVREDGSEVFRARTVWAPEAAMARQLAV